LKLIQFLKIISKIEFRQSNPDIKPLGVIWIENLGIKLPLDYYFYLIIIILISALLNGIYFESISELNFYSSIIYFLIGLFLIFFLIDNYFLKHPNHDNIKWLLAGLPLSKYLRYYFLLIKHLFGWKFKAFFIYFIVNAIFGLYNNYMEFIFYFYMFIILFLFFIEYTLLLVFFKDLFSLFRDNIILINALKIIRFIPYLIFGIITLTFNDLFQKLELLINLTSECFYYLVIINLVISYIIIKISIKIGTYNVNLC
jgi:hypothetical protein